MLPHMDKLHAEMDRLRAERNRICAAANLAPQTISGYAYDWRMFGEWCALMGLASLPATTDTVALYLTWLLSDGKKISTVRRRSAAIAHYHGDAGHSSPINEDTRSLVTGAQRLRAEKPRQMRPLSLAQLDAISSHLAGDGRARALRDRALIVVGWASALRRSNIAALDLSDIEMVEEGIVVSIAREKQDQQGRGRLIGIPRGAGLHTCPVKCLEDWIAVRGRAEGPLFPRLNPKHRGGPMDGNCVFRVVRRCVKLIGLDPNDRYGGHSLRAGFITAAGEAGVGELLIASQSGHRNMQTLRKYFRRTELFRSNALATMGL